MQMPYRFVDFSRIRTPSFLLTFAAYLEKDNQY